MGRIEEIDREIERLSSEHEAVTGAKTEVYSRIVGYYRALDNWNRGKSEEFSHRRPFLVPEGAPAGGSERVGRDDPRNAVIEAPIHSATAEYERVRYELFTRTSCPNCPAMKRAVSQLEVPGVDIDVDAPAGIERAIELSIYATPTVVFFDERDREISRSTSPLELARVYAHAV